MERVETERKTETETENETHLSYLALFSNCLQQQELDQAKDKNFIQMPNVDGKGPNTWIIFHCLIMCISRKLGWEHHSQYMGVF